MPDSKSVNQSNTSFSVDVSKELSVDIGELRKQNNSTHERIFARLENLENRSNFNAKDIENDINELRKQNNSTHERVFDKLASLEKRVDVQDIRYEQIVEKLSSALRDVKEIKEKPIKQLDSTVEKIIALLLAAIFGVIFGKTGLNF